LAECDDNPPAEAARSAAELGEQRLDHAPVAQLPQRIYHTPSVLRVCFGEPGKQRFHRSGSTEPAECSSGLAADVGVDVVERGEQWFDHA
jgi:hypothetical protein